MDDHFGFCENMTAGDTDRVTLLAALHWKIVPPFAQSSGELSTQMDLLGKCIAVQVNATLPRNPEVGIDFMLSSTVASGAITGIPEVTTQLFDVIETGCGHRPMAFLHTYMCTGWGYALRYFSQHTDTRFVLLSIVDVDIHDMNYHRRHAVIGKLGFGITTLLLRLPANRQVTAETGGPYSDSAFKELIRALKAHNARSKPALSFVPFFSANLGGLSETLLGKSNLGANRHDEYGHCFGSDPWIGLIEWLQQKPLSAPVNVTAAAVAFKGYYTLCDIGVLPETLIGLQVVGGSDEELRAAILQVPPLQRAGCRRPEIVPA